MEGVEAYVAVVASVIVIIEQLFGWSTCESNCITQFVYLRAKEILKVTP
jgi:hypothetical protein